MILKHRQVYFSLSLTFNFLGLVFRKSSTYMLQKATPLNSEGIYWLCLYTIHENTYCVYVEGHTHTLIKLFSVVLHVWEFSISVLPMNYPPQHNERPSI